MSHREITRLLAAPGTATERPDPWEEASCRAFPHELGLWDEATLDHAAPEAAVALPVCLACPLRQACEDIATETEAADPMGGAHGIWGGRSPRQRHGVHLRWRQPAHSVCRIEGCTQASWAGAKAPWCAEHLCQIKGWTLTHPADLDPVLWERAAARRLLTERQRHTTTWSERRSAERLARREAAAAIPGQRRAADDLAEETR